MKVKEAMIYIGDAGFEMFQVALIMFWLTFIISRSVWTIVFGFGPALIAGNVKEWGE